MKGLGLIVVLVGLAILVAGCGDRPPKKPTASFRPEVAGVVSSVSDLGCGVARVALDGGESRELHMDGLPESSPAGCSDTNATLPALLLGVASWPRPEALFFFGHDQGGKPWYGWVPRRDPAPDSPPGFSGPSQWYWESSGGAFEEGTTIHLPSGVVLDKSPDYKPPDYYPSDMPLVAPVGSGIYFDSKGAVIEILVPVSG